MTRLRLDRGKSARVLRVLQVCALLLLTLNDAFAQCALCKDGIAAAPAETREAMNYAIIGLALAPYVVAALAAWALSPGLRALVRARLERLNPPRAGVRS